MNRGIARRRLTRLIVLGLAVTVIAGFFVALNALFDAPWAYSVFGSPTLTGTWAGEFTMPSGAQFIVLLDLRRPLLINGEIKAQGDSGGLIGGQGSWCDNRGRQDEVPLDGWVPVLSGNRGTASGIEIRLQSATHPQPGVQPSYFSGAWDRDTLTLIPRFVFWDGFAQAFVSSSANPDLTAAPAIVLRKAGEEVYRARCAALRGASR